MGKPFALSKGGNRRQSERLGHNRSGGVADPLRHHQKTPVLELFAEVRHVLARYPQAAMLLTLNLRKNFEGLTGLPRISSPTRGTGSKKFAAPWTWRTGRTCDWAWILSISMMQFTGCARRCRMPRMSLHIYSRHAKNCPHSSKGVYYTKCSCP